MKIGLVIYGSLSTLSGGYFYDRKLVETLRAAGDSVEIFSLPWRNYAAHLLDNVHFRLPEELDILIQDELNHPSLLVANRQRHPSPVVSLVHHLRCSEARPHWQNWLYRLVERHYLQSVDGFIFNSETTRREVQQLAGRARPFVVAPPPTDRFGVQVSEEEIIRRAHASELRILFLGNVIQRKGLHLLLEALSEATFDFRLDVVGSLSFEPGYAQAMQDKARRSGLAQRVFFHGALDQEPLAEKLRTAHVLALPSSYEGFGIAYLEGMGFGLPAIGTDQGAAGEILRHGVDGFIVSGGDARELADRLRFLAERREVLAQMGVAARERYLRQPSWEQTSHQIRKFLCALVEMSDLARSPL
ncbi:MAG: glycosyltransferase family 4 protein [Anaerolineae bacterium]